MIEKGTFVRRNPRAVKAMGSEKRAQHLAANPKESYGFKVRTGIKSETSSVAEGREVSARANWCRTFVDPGNDSWNYRFEPKRRRGRPGELMFLFTKHEDAVAFTLRWSGVEATK
jgi:hypothetical protein